MINILNETAIFQIASNILNNDDIVLSSDATSNAVTTFSDYFNHHTGANQASLTKASSSFSLPTANNYSLNFWQKIILGSFLLLLILFCTVGNFFVILAIMLERDLRSRPQYNLIFSLAIADLLVGLVVTPLHAWATIKQAWSLGAVLCDIWISADVLVCTSSILHLVGIALDRYWSVTDIYYVQNRTRKRIFLILVFIWVLSLLISLGPIFGWKDEQFETRLRLQRVCLISQRISYQVFSTATAFYIPLCAIIIIYYKIMRTAKKRFRRKHDRQNIHQSLINLNAKHHKETTKKLIKSKNLRDTTTDENLQLINSAKTSATSEPDKFKHKVQYNENEDHTFNPSNLLNTNSFNQKTVSMPLIPTVKLETNSQTASRKNDKLKPSFLNYFSKSTTNTSTSTILKPKKVKNFKENMETRRERKAWRTLAIITGTFVACWTPFFLVSLYRPICGCNIPPVIETVTAWLGYLNSALNPIIYTVFSTDFRMAFQRILKRMCLIKNF